MSSTPADALDTSEEEQQHLTMVQELLARQRRVENLVHRQDMPRHQLVEGLVHKQHLSELKVLLDRMPPDRVARILEALPQDDSVLVWEMVAADRGDEILDELSDALRETLSAAQASPRKPCLLYTSRCV